MFAYELIGEAQKVCIANIDFDKSITGNVYAFDSTTIDLCFLNVFWWATFRRTKAAIKVHTLLDVKTNIISHSIAVFVNVIIEYFSGTRVDYFPT
jgi:hypothetical protein